MKLLKKNIVLIGMPGCGKTTIGRELAKRIGMEFCDTDEYIVETMNKSINELFENGEEHFRKIEQAIVKKVAREYPKVISTGGGVVTKKENILELKKSGIIVFVNRSLKDITSDIQLKNRPLLKSGIKQIEELYKKRYELYKMYCKYEVINENLEKCIKDIQKYINNYN